MLEVKFLLKSKSKAALEMVKHELEQFNRSFIYVAETIEWETIATSNKIYKLLAIVKIDSLYQLSELRDVLTQAVNRIDERIVFIK